LPIPIGYFQEWQGFEKLRNRTRQLGIAQQFDQNNRRQDQQMVRQSLVQNTDIFAFEAGQVCD